MPKDIDKKFNQLEKKLDERLDKVVVKLIEYIDLRIEEVKREVLALDKKFEEFKNNVYDKLDWLISQYKKLDEEREVIFYRQEKINKRLDNHEVRISRLESQISATTS